MSEFKCEVVRVRLEPHPNADAIEICRVGDYQSIVRKGQFNEGDLAVYLPEQAIIPEWMLREMSMYDDAKQKGALAGSMGNRVKAIKLRGVLSQGVMFPLVVVDEFWHVANILDSVGVEEGVDVSKFLGVVKYEPALPSHMRGRITGVDYEATHKYDFDNLKKMPTMFNDGEEVVITEKIHGTLIQVGVVPSSKANDKYYGGRVTISSKGLGAKGFVLDHNDETNLYAQAAEKHGLLDFALHILGDYADEHDSPVFIMGEVFGKTLNGVGVQDLTYTGKPLDFRAFDICIGNRGSEKYMPFDEFSSLLDEVGILRVPVLYVGPYCKAVVLEHTDGDTTLHGSGDLMTALAHIREGVVVKSRDEIRNPHFGRKIAKSISEAYLLRKGSVTEFQ